MMESKRVSPSYTAIELGWTDRGAELIGEKLNLSNMMRSRRASPSYTATLSARVLEDN